MLRSRGAGGGSSAGSGFGGSETTWVTGASVSKATTGRKLEVINADKQGGG